MTTEPLVTTGPPPPPSPSPRRYSRWWGIVGSALLVLVMVAVVTANVVRVPYVLISPGGATPLDDTVVSVAGAPTHPHDGTFLFLTVQVSTRDPTVMRWLFAKLDDDVTVEKRENVIGCASYAQSNKLNELLMQESQDTAKTLALRRLGHEVPERGTQVVIADVMCDGPSFGKLELGDVLLEVDGQAVTRAEDVRPLVLEHEPGDTIQVGIERNGEPREVSITLGRAPEIDPPPGREGGLRGGDAFMGIVSQAIADEDYPFEIDIDTRRVSGPSAGLAFTLALIDELTRGELTGGTRVAVTGSILPDGQVAMVGGVAQKTVAARESGATLMLVPRGEAKEARAHAGEMRVVAVDTLEDALRALDRFGGDPIPPSPPQTTTQ